MGSFFSVGTGFFGFIIMVGFFDIDDYRGFLYGGDYFIRSFEFSIELELNIFFR